MRLFKKAEVFDILKSSEGNRTIGLRYGVSHSAISKIRRGLSYKETYAEFQKASRAKVHSLLETLPQSYSNVYYYLDSKYLRISMDDILISLDLSAKTLVNIEFNTVIRGHRIDYVSALAMIKEYGMLKT